MSGDNVRMTDDRWSDFKQQYNTLETKKQTTQGQAYTQQQHSQSPTQNQQQQQHSQSPTQQQNAQANRPFMGAISNLYNPADERAKERERKLQYAKELAQQRADVEARKMLEKEKERLLDLKLEEKLSKQIEDEKRARAQPDSKPQPSEMMPKPEATSTLQTAPSSVPTTQKTQAVSPSKAASFGDTLNNDLGARMRAKAAADEAYKDALKQQIEDNQRRKQLEKEKEEEAERKFQEKLDKQREEEKQKANKEAGIVTAPGNKNSGDGGTSFIMEHERGGKHSHNHNRNSVAKAPAPAITESKTDTATATQKTHTTTTTDENREDKKGDRQRASGEGVVDRDTEEKRARNRLSSREYGSKDFRSGPTVPYSDFKEIMGQFREVVTELNQERKEVYKQTKEEVMKLKEVLQNQQDKREKEMESLLQQHAAAARNSARNKVPEPFSSTSSPRVPRKAAGYSNYSTRPTTSLNSSSSEMLHSLGGTTKFVAPGEVNSVFTSTLAEPIRGPPTSVRPRVAAMRPMSVGDGLNLRSADRLFEKNATKLAQLEAIEQKKQRRVEKSTLQTFENDSSIQSLLADYMANGKMKPLTAQTSYRPPPTPDLDRSLLSETKYVASKEVDSFF